MARSRSFIIALFLCFGVTHGQGHTVKGQGPLAPEQVGGGLPEPEERVGLQSAVDLSDLVGELNVTSDKDVSDATAKDLQDILGLSYLTQTENRTARRVSYQSGGGSSVRPSLINIGVDISLGLNTYPNVHVCFWRYIPKNELWRFVLSAFTELDLSLSVLKRSLILAAKLLVRLNNGSLALVDINLRAAIRVATSLRALASIIVDLIIRLRLRVKVVLCLTVVIFRPVELLAAIDINALGLGINLQLDAELDALESAPELEAEGQTPTNGASSSSRPNAAGNNSQSQAVKALKRHSAHESPWMSNKNLRSSAASRRAPDSYEDHEGHGQMEENGWK